MRRTAEAAARTRDGIVAAAREAFGDQGYAATSLAQVAEAAGVTKGALYHHFANKAALFEAVFVALGHELDDTVRRAALSAGHDPATAFLTGCAALLDFAGRPDCQRIVTIDGPAVLGNAEWRRIDTEIGLATMRAGLQFLDGAGLLAAPYSEQLVVLLFGALTEATLTVSRNEPGTPTRRQLLDEFAALVFGRGG